MLVDLLLGLAVLAFSSEVEETKTWHVQTSDGNPSLAKLSPDIQKSDGNTGLTFKLPPDGEMMGKRATRSRYVLYRPGNTSLILTVPHDGQMKPVSIPDRTNGCKDRSGKCQFKGHSRRHVSKVCKALLISDSNTLDVAERVWQEIIDRTGHAPHLIVNKLHRSKLDANRDIEDAARDSVEAKKAYRDFHGAIQRAKASLGGQPGLILDFHGQRHGKNSTELGYAYTKDQLNSGNLARLGSLSSISSLLTRTRRSPTSLLSGPSSLGAAWEKSGYRAVPSPRKPRPGTDKYYRGGYITQTHGSSGGGNVDAIQLEMPSELTRSTTSRRKFAVTIGGVISRFHAKFYP